MGMEWNVDPLEFMGEVNASLKKVTEEVAIEIFAGVVMRTPVHTGNLRASWKITHTTVDFGIVTEGTVNRPLPPPIVPKSFPDLPDFPIMFVTNCTPYAEEVERGGPHNPPVGMVELTLQSLRS